MIETDILWRSWCRIIPLSETETGRPSMWEMWAALETERFFSSEWKSWETSPNCPATKQKSWPKLSRRCWSGSTCLGSGWQYFLSMFCVQDTNVSWSPATKCERRSWVMLSALCLATALFQAASLAPDDMFPRQLRRHEDWAL